MLKTPINEANNFVPVGEIDVSKGYLEFDIAKDPISAEYAIHQILKDEPVAVCMGSVYALIADAHSDRAIDRTREIKRRPNTKPFGLLMDAESICEIVDLDKVHPDFHKLFESPETINQLFGSKGFLRFPLKQSIDFNEGLIGPNHSIQAFTFWGDEVAYPFEESIRQSLKEKHPNGKGEIMITSYNISGEPSIIDAQRAGNLSASSKLFIQIDRNSSNGTGSYSIYRFDENGIEKVRGGTGEVAIDEALSLG